MSPKIHGAAVAGTDKMELEFSSRLHKIFSFRFPVPSRPGPSHPFPTGVCFVNLREKHDETNDFVHEEAIVGGEEVYNNALQQLNRSTYDYDNGESILYGGIEETETPVSRSRPRPLSLWLWLFIFS